jgi:hypothetical protein
MVVSREPTILPEIGGFGLFRRPYGLVGGYWLRYLWLGC